jgi:cell division transport system ATP-binding protein
MIRFESVSKAYDNGYQALKNVSFELETGEITFLTGHSGAGKSTLLKLIMMMEPASRGQIFIAGRSLARLSSNYVPYFRRNIGMIFQNPQLLADRTVYENVAAPLYVSGYKPDEIKRRVRAALDKVGLLDKERLKPPTLSSGEQQRVGIARAVVNKPKILLADEPTGNLDPKLSFEIMELFEAFHRVGVTVLIATHDLRLISQLHHRTITLKKGQVIGETSNA